MHPAQALHRLHRVEPRQLQADRGGRRRGRSPQEPEMRTGDVQAVYPDPARSWIGAAPIPFAATLLLVCLVYGLSLYFVDFDVGRLWGGLARLARWAAKAWQDDTGELGVLIERAIETLAMAVIGTTIGVVIAAPCCILAAQNITPSPLLYTPMRWFLNTLRGIDSFIFALLFVAAVGLGPSAGVLGVGLHSARPIPKLWSPATQSAPTLPSRTPPPPRPLPP